MSKSIGVLLVLGAVCAVGCGSSGSTTGGDSSAKAASTGDAKGGGTGYAGYVDAYCACKGDTKCITDAGVKFASSMGDAGKADVSVSQKLAECMKANPPKM